MNYCTKCVYPQAGVNLDLDDDGVCSACAVYADAAEITPDEWSKRKERLVRILEEARASTPGDYDCIIPVGGGKDSYWQVHVITELGFDPLLVTYHGNNYLPEGQSNLDRMAEVFNCDHYIFHPGVEGLKKINKLTFSMMGDMNWHNHAGIRIIPMQAALKFQTPLFIWGETPWDISGMYYSDDFAEFNKSMVFEHDMRGYSRSDMIFNGGLK